MNSLLGHIKWLFRSRRTRQLDEIAFGIADRYGMRKEYLAARKFGFSPLEALEDWDFIRPEERELSLEPLKQHLRRDTFKSGNAPQYSFKIKCYDNY